MAQLECGSVCVTGNHRENNEDRCMADPDGRYFLVADGMGGQAAGEKASELAIELTAEKLEEDLDFESSSRDDVVKAIDEAVARANREIINVSESDPSFHNMGTTLVFLIAVADRLYVGGIGDSRVYLLRGENLERLTTDHSVTQALIDAGTISAEDAATHHYRNVLYRYLGTKEGSTGTQPREIIPEAGDRYLLCSDGVNEGVSEDRLREMLQLRDEGPQQRAEAVVQAALDGGSRDNITCLIVDAR